MAIPAQSSCNDHMARPPRIVGSRDLKTRLGAYLERVRRGETLVITDRGTSVAELRPVSASQDQTETEFQKMGAEGLITRPTRTGRLSRRRPLRLPRGASGVDAIRKERDESW